MSRMTTAALIAKVLQGAPVGIDAYDGSSAGPKDAEVRLVLRSPRALSYLLTAPSQLGLARAYVSGELEIQGEPYAALSHIWSDRIGNLSWPERLNVLRNVDPKALRWVDPPPEEYGARRVRQGLRHSKARDAAAISPHYDVSNTFYEWVLGPSMTYTCACFPSEDATLEEAQAFKYDLVCQKLGLKPGMRLLDVGSGWGGMVRHAAREYGVTAVGVTLSREQASWAQHAIKEQRLDDRAEVRFGDYRDVADNGFDAVSSIGLTEHIGVRNYPAYFSFIRDKLVPGGRLLNHCITRPDNNAKGTGAFIDRYVFPDGELTGSGRIITGIQDVGMEVRHEENLREHYALTLKGWNRNLVDNWDECVRETDEGTAKVWGIYMAGSRLAFERNEIQLHQVLAVRPDQDGRAHLPLRPDWLS